MKHSWLVSLLSLFLAASAWGQSVHVVAGDGSGDFLQLDDAVAAAANGDVILVRPHTARYDATTISGKSLTIVGEGAVRPETEDVRVTGLVNGQTGLLVTNSVSVVGVDSAFTGGQGFWSVGDTGVDVGIGPSPIPLSSGLVARNSSTVNDLSTAFATGNGPAPPGSEAATFYAQPLVAESSPSHLLGAPSSVPVVSADIPRP